MLYHANIIVTRRPGVVVLISDKIDFKARKY